MKSVTTTILILFSMLSSLAQNTSTQSLQKFSVLKVYNRISVTLIKSEENKLTIAKKNETDVRVMESNGVLMLKMDSDKFIAGNILAVNLYYTESLSSIDANENAKIKSNGSIKGSTLEIKAQESGVINLNIDVKNVISKSSSGSEIRISGTAESQNAIINTGAKIYNKGLKSKNTTVTVLAGGRAEVYASEKAVAKVKAGGVIIIHGNPKILDKRDNFGGTIQVIE